MKRRPLFCCVCLCLSMPAMGELSQSVNQSVIVVYEPPVRVPVVVPNLPVAVYVERPDQETAKKLQLAIKRTNELRAEKGLPPLRYDENLSAYAQFRASELKESFSHVRPNGQSYKVGMNIGRAVGENIAAGKATADETIVQFRNSPKHYDTILYDQFTKIGMGLAYVPQSKYGYYWVQIFGADNTQSAYAFLDNSQDLLSTQSTK